MANTTLYHTLRRLYHTVVGQWANTTATTPNTSEHNNDVHNDT
ncbi:hypothetical protein OZX74_06705 [Bifidobacterium sp. ESL0798]|nr:hypothetical protein [Bifidobacterium sp. ESL0798]WEV73601.1 hypothetical protein OZX74_06705 [Bifidobacterium sp. ESL0798]